MPFEVETREERWWVWDGAVRFGPYSTREKAEDSAGSLNRQRAWARLPLADLVASQGGSRP